MSLRRAILIACLLSAAPAMAQPAGPPPNLPPPPGGVATTEVEPEDGADEAPAPDKGPSLLKGDVVELASGKRLEGVQVVRKTPKGYEIQTLPDLPPMIVPLKQVKNIEYDEIDPRNPGATSASPESGAEPGIERADEVSPELHDKLVTPLKAAQFTDVDFIEVLDATVVKAGVPLDISPAVQQMPVGQRLWTVNIAEGSNSLQVLKEQLAVDFTDIEVATEIDRVQIRPRVSTPEGADLAPGTPSVTP